MDKSDHSSDSVRHAKSGGQYKQPKQATTINIDVAASECIYRNTSSSPPRCKKEEEKLSSLLRAALSHTDQFVLSEVVCGVELITVPEASEIGWTCELLGE